MKISFNSLIFKTLLSLFILSSVFIGLMIFTAKNSFSQGYVNLVQEDLASIKENISPSIALNLGFDFDQSIEEIASSQLKNEKIIFIQIDSKKFIKPLIFSNDEKSLKELEEAGHFKSTDILIDPSTNLEIATLTLVYSNESYNMYMQKFYNWFALSVLLFILSMLSIGYMLFKSLKQLNILAVSFENFNPDVPKKFVLNSKINDEIHVISKSANVMVENLTKYIEKTENLNATILQKEAHLKEAQRMAKVGSFDYNVVNGELILSDEYYRILGVNLSRTITWNDFLNFISKADYQRVIRSIEKALKNGAQFHLNYSIILENSKELYIQTKGKVRKKVDGSIRITAVSLDITTDVENKKTIEKLAYHDSLTDLANRTLLKDRMNKALQNAKRNDDSLAVMFLDLDHFKLINDTLGHSVGDELLIYIAKALQEHIRESDTLARFGGDEFVILLPSIKSIEDAKKIAAKIQKTLQQKHDIGTHQLYITSSIGVSIYPEHGKDADELIRSADTAMYEAKNDGRNKYKIYSNSMGNFIDKQLTLEQDLIHAVKSKNQIEVFYQAKIDANTKVIYGAEALVRWRHPTKGLVYPDNFIHIAESTGLMIELGNIITEEAIKQINEFNKLGLVNLKIAINLSARQFQDSSLVPFIASMLQKYQIDPIQVEFEITETVSMSNMTNTLRILEELKTIGVSIAIDDFGTGHSSLAYLKKFPINTLKIDQSFVFGIIEDEEDKIITQTIISMAKSLGLKTVAEGVETLEHAKMLRDMGCDLLQGYYYSKPITKDEFINLVQEYIPNN